MLHIYPIAPQNLLWLAYGKKILEKADCKMLAKTLRHVHSKVYQFSDIGSYNQISMKPAQLINDEKLKWCIFKQYAPSFQDFISQHSWVQEIKPMDKTFERKVIFLIFKDFLAWGMIPILSNNRSCDFNKGEHDGWHNAFSSIEKHEWAWR